MKLVEILGLLDFNTKSYVVKFNNKELSKDEIDTHMYDYVVKLEPKVKDNEGYLLITLEDDIYWDINH
jgi:hypothetical protein